MAVEESKIVARGNELEKTVMSQEAKGTLAINILDLWNQTKSRWETKKQILKYLNSILKSKGSIMRNSYFKIIA